jgi:hypothetical protein
MVGHGALHDRQDGAAHDGYRQEAGAIARQRSEFRYSQGKDGPKRVPRSRACPLGPAE